MENKSDFEEIILLPDEVKELRKFSRGSPMADCPSSTLQSYGLVCVDCSGIDSNGFPIFAETYSISEKGIRYLAYQSQSKKRTIGKYLADKWIDFLALVVAVIALIISIIALNS